MLPIQQQHHHGGLHDLLLFLFLFLPISVRTIISKITKPIFAKFLGLAEV